MVRAFKLSNLEALFEALLELCIDPLLSHLLLGLRILGDRLLGQRLCECAVRKGRRLAPGVDAAHASVANESVDRLV